MVAFFTGYYFAVFLFSFCSNLHFLNKLFAVTRRTMKVYNESFSNNSGISSSCDSLCDETSARSIWLFLHFVYLSSIGKTATRANLMYLRLWAKNKNVVLSSI